MKNSENVKPSDDGQPSSNSIAEIEAQHNQNDAKAPNLTDSNSAVNLLSQGLIESMPDVSEHVINAHQQTQTEQIQQNSTETDKRGEYFNSELHAVDDDGKPRLTAAGYFAKKRGRKNGQTASVIGSIESQQNAPQQNHNALHKQKMAGRAAANTLLMLGVVVGGDEWHPMKNAEHGLDEKANLESAFSDYFVAKNMDDIPAGIALSIAIIGYAAPRFTMPKTQARSKSAWQKLKIWYVNRKLKKHRLKAVDDGQERTAEENKKAD